jgi:hypothetical protein
MGGSWTYIAPGLASRLSELIYNLVISFNRKFVNGQKNIGDLMGYWFEAL